MEDGDGTWWHFYWGTKGGKEGIPNRILCFFGVTVERYSWCVEFTGDATSLDEINEAKQYGGKYETMYYFAGDFSGIIDGLKNPSGKYNLYTNNCSQFSLEMLALADTEYSDLFSGAGNHVLPASANKYIANNLNRYASTNMIYYEYALQESYLEW